MSPHAPVPGLIASGFFDGAVARILALQRPDGSIPWFDIGVIDPWNTAEAAMGLAIAGRIGEARAAFAYLVRTQLPDGSWWADYGAAVPIIEDRYQGDPTHQRIRDTNFCAYIATGVWHHVRLTGDLAFGREMWPTVRRAIDFVLDHQSAEGEIRWSARDPHTPEEDALLTGSSSIYKSLASAIALGLALGDAPAAWRTGRARLGEAVRAKPHRFDRQWPKKDDFSMDWFYPILSGAIGGQQAATRIDAGWARFVEADHGCRCLASKPWVTVAESCELILTLLKLGRRREAETIFGWLARGRDEDGSYWMGWSTEELVPWPREKPAWTAGALLLAADALTGATRASDFFTAPDEDDAISPGP